MKLLIVRRWGSAVPGETVTVDDELQARWLLDNHFAERTNQPGSSTAGAIAPGTDGPDQLAGGDHTRRRPETRKAEYGPNRARPVSGSPVAYTAGVREEDKSGASDSPDEPAASGPSTKVSGSGRRRSKSDA